MTEQLYRVCWRNYWAQPVRRRPQIERCPPMPIGEAYEFMRECKEGEPDPVGLADYWLDPA